MPWEARLSHTPLDRAEIRRRLLLRLFGSPLTVLPTVLGTASLLSPLLFDLDPAIPIFAGIAGLVVGGATIAVNALARREVISRRILEELEEEAAADQQAEIERLRQRLEADGDDRTQVLLSDLLALTRTVQQDDWRHKVDVVAAADLLNGIDTLFAGCIENLDRAADLAETAAKISAPAAREAIESERLRLVEDVADSVASLGELLGRMRVLGTAAEGAADLASIRADLDRNVQAAQQTIEETRSLAQRARAASRIPE